MIDNAAEYCLLWIRWWPICMTKSEWASWMQAVFSVAAIGAAFFAAWNQRRLEKADAAGRARVRAEIAGTALLLRLGTVIGGLAGTEGDVRAAMTKGVVLNFRDALNLLTSLPYPTDDEVLAVVDHDHLAAHLLLRGRSMAMNAAFAVRAFTELGKRPSEAEWVQLAGTLAVSQDQLRQAQDRLIDVVPKGKA